MASTSKRSIHFHDIPDSILPNIFSLVTDTRTRNSMSLVCLKWNSIERSTRTSLSLRGNIHNLYFLPTCFKEVSHLDLSLLSPWGHSIFDSSPDPVLLAQLLHRAFPSVVSLTVYARSPSTLHLLAPHWPNLVQIKFVCWHQRSESPLGAGFLALFEHCNLLSTLDLSHFNCWTEDLPTALEAYPFVGASLSHLNILTYASTEGFKSHELLSITSACPNLRELLASCVFDHRFSGFVGDETFSFLASNCPRLSLLHIVDTSSLTNSRGDPDDEGYTSEDARISHTKLVDIFAGWPLLEELVLDVCHNVRDTWPALEILNSKCPKLKYIKLGQFHGICRGIEARLNGIALCSRLESLSLKNSADLTDSSLVCISLGCQKLSKFEVQGCKRITKTGMTKFVSILKKTLIDVKISCCKQLNAVCSLQSLVPIQDRIQRLHIDCVWEDVEKLEGEVSSSSSRAKLKCPFDHFQAEKRVVIWDDTGLKKKSMMCTDHENCYSSWIWPKLQYLSLWIAAGELLTPLTLSGLEECPVLEEIRIKVEGDCRHQTKPAQELGLANLIRYPQLSRMHLDSSSATGFALTAPLGHVDLSLWERFYLRGIGNLNLTELNYWPPQDRDVNQRTLSLPAVGLLSESGSLRKLFIHGTANEHFMMMLLKVPTLRDVQLREDYYPAPGNETSTEMRVDSCSRFENALNRRQIPD